VAKHLALTRLSTTDSSLELDTIGIVQYSKTEVIEQIYRFGVGSRALFSKPGYDPWVELIQLTCELLQRT